MTRHVRIGFATFIVFILAVITFTYLWGNALWTSRSAAARGTDSTSRTTSESTDDVSQPTEITAVPPASSVPVKQTPVNQGTPTDSKDSTVLIRPLVLQHTNKTPSHQHQHPHPKVIHVKKGQCLWTIALANDTTVTALEKKNHLKTTVLQIGQALTLPNTHTAQLTIQTKAKSASNTLVYTVQSNDSLWKISVEYGISINQLRADNHLTSNVLRDGQKLQIRVPHAKYHPTAASRKLIAHAPKSLIPVYQAAGKKYHIPWTVLAAIHKEETDFDMSGADVSSAGAMGPMQFMPETFKIYGVPAPGHRTANILNVDDAIYSAAHMLAAQGFNKDPYHAIFQYNHSVRYVDDILHMSAI